MSYKTEVPISEGAKSTEENVLAIYINCPELLYEEHIDKNLFSYPPHKQLFEAILHGLEGGSWNVAVYNSEIANNGLADLHAYLLGKYVSRVPLNSYLDELRKNYVQRECLKVLKKSMNTLQKYNELNIYALYNDLEKLQNKYQHEDDVITIASVEKKEQEWLIKDYIPRYEITDIGGDGGVGKTAFWVSIVGSFSAGKPCFFEDADVKRDPMRILYLTRENSNATNLKEKFEVLGANMNNILCIGDTNMNFFKYKIGSPDLEYLIKKHRPDVLVLDPLQSFIPEHVNLIARNHVRPMMDWLMAMTKKYEVTILLIMHSKKNASSGGRDRLADSSDIFDGVRQVLMVGKTDEEGIKYVAPDKANLSEQAPTILFEQVDHGLPKLVGFSNQNDGDYLDARRNRSKSKGVSKLDQACTFILNELSRVAPEGLTFEEILKTGGGKHAKQTLTDARTYLINDNRIEKVTESRGKGKGTKVYYRLIQKEKEEKEEKSESCSSTESLKTEKVQVIGLFDA